MATCAGDIVGEFGVQGSSKMLHRVSGEVRLSGKRRRRRHPLALAFAPPKRGRERESSPVLRARGAGTPRPSETQPESVRQPRQALASFQRAAEKTKKNKNVLKRSRENAITSPVLRPKLSGGRRERGYR